MENLLKFLNNNESRVLLDIVFRFYYSPEIMVGDHTDQIA